MKRFLCAWFPNWPLDRLARRKRRLQSGQTGARPDDIRGRPFALIETGAGGVRIAAASTPAMAQGVSPGLTLTDALARCPGLTTEAIDRAADDAALKHLAHWMGRYSPIVALTGENTITLETTGCDHLFGGEAALLAELKKTLVSFGFTAGLAIAPTPAAAHALAHTRQDPAPCQDEAGLADGLAPLPVAHLRLADAPVQMLRRFGLTRIGQLYGIDRKALARRFASQEVAGQVVTRLDQALGLRREPLHALGEPADYTARQPCPEPLLHGDGIAAGLEGLAADLCARLTADGRGARAFLLKAFRSDGTLGQVRVETARPVRDPAHILRLFREKLDTLDPGFGIDLLVLEGARTGAMQTGAPALSGDLTGQDVDLTELSALADRITARLGAGTVSQITPQARHLPESSETRAAFEGELADWSGMATTAPRPLRIFERPEPVDVLAEVPDGPPLRFVWRKVARKVARAEGPERIAPEWWVAGGTALPEPLSPAPRETVPDSIDRERRERPGRFGPKPQMLMRGFSPPDTRSTMTKMLDRPVANPLRPAAQATSPASGGRHPAKMTGRSDPPPPAGEVGPQGSEGASPSNSPERDPSRSGAERAIKRTRDYYRIEDQEGRRYWVFRDGLYGDGRGGTPAWYIQGLFG